MLQTGRNCRFTIIGMTQEVCGIGMVEGVKVFVDSVILFGLCRIRWGNPEAAFIDSKIKNYLKHKPYKGLLAFQKKIKKEKISKILLQYGMLSASIKR